MYSYHTGPQLGASGSVVTFPPFPLTPGRSLAALLNEIRRRWSRPQGGGRKPTDRATAQPEAKQTGKWAEVSVWLDATQTALPCFPQHSSTASAVLILATVALKLCSCSNAIKAHLFLHLTFIH